MTQPALPNIYKLLEKDFKVFDVLIDVGYKGFYDLVDFENSEFKILTGIDKEFERNTPFEDYRIRKTENLNLTDEEWIMYSKELLKIYDTRFDIKTIDLFAYDFGLNVNSLIICNKVLHFYNDNTKFELFEKFYQSLQRDGIMYLKINHCSHPNNTDLDKMTKIGDCIYQNKEVPEDIRYLIEPIKFINSLKSCYHLLADYTHEDDKTLTVVIKK